MTCPRVRLQKRAAPLLRQALPLQKDQYLKHSPATETPAPLPKKSHEGYTTSAKLQPTFFGPFPRLPANARARVCLLCWRRRGEWLVKFSAPFNQQSNVILLTFKSATSEEFSQV